MVIDITLPSDADESDLLESNQNPELKDIVKVQDKSKEEVLKFNLKAEILHPYYRIFMLVLFTSLVGFASIGTAASQCSYSKFIGPLVIISKGAAGAILTTSVFLIMSVNYDLLACMRKRLRYKCLSWLDHNIIVHRFCGYVITFYGVVHGTCHLCGSMYKISNTRASEIKKYFYMYEYDEQMTYSQVVLTTMTGLTGLMLLAVMLTMAVTAMKCVRRRCFQVFGYIHVVLFPIFCLLLMAHGLHFWLNWGVPFALITITPGFILLSIQQLMKVFVRCKYKFEVVDVNLSSNRKYMMIYLTKPKNYHFKHGQFCFVNVPQVCRYQWHPFSIASTPNNPYLILMVKKAGDWTEKLINMMYEAKRKSMRMEEFGIIDYEEHDLFDLLHDIHQSIPLKTMKQHNRRFYPTVNISNACPTPCQNFFEKESLILIGGGSGIAPFLPFLDEAIRADKGKENSLFNKGKCPKSAFLVFIAREGEQVSWVSNYIFHLLTSECLIPQFDFYIYITMNKHCETLPSFLFWRALLLVDASFNKGRAASKNSGSKLLNRDSNKEKASDIEESPMSMLEKSPVKIKFGRPDFVKLFTDNADKLGDKCDAYSCSTPMMSTHLYKVFYHLNKTTNVRFHYTPEELG